VDSITKTLLKSRNGRWEKEKRTLKGGWGTSTNDNPKREKKDLEGGIFEGYSDLDRREKGLEGEGRTKMKSDTSW